MIERIHQKQAKEQLVKPLVLRHTSRLSLSGRRRWVCPMSLLVV